MFARLASRFVRFCVRHGRADHLPGYMNRWELIRTKWFGVRLHHTLRPDTDRYLHDHPWWNVSLILFGGYHEAVPLDSANQVFTEAGMELRRTHWRGPGHIVLRRAKSRHALCSIVAPCWSLFIVGRHVQDWGFYTPRGKVLAAQRMMGD